MFQILLKTEPKYIMMHAEYQRQFLAVVQHKNRQFFSRITCQESIYSIFCTNLNILTLVFP